MSSKNVIYNNRDQLVIAVSYLLSSVMFSPWSQRFLLCWVRTYDRTASFFPLHEPEPHHDHDPLLPLDHLITCVSKMFLSDFSSCQED